MSEARQILNEFLLTWWNCKDNPERFPAGYENMMRTGLCANLMTFCILNDLPWQNAGQLMEKSWEELGLNLMHPFHRSFRDYIKESDQHIQHLNQMRREWVQAHLTEQGLI